MEERREKDYTESAHRPNAGNERLVQERWVVDKKVPDGGVKEMRDDGCDWGEFWLMGWC